MLLKYYFFLVIALIFISPTIARPSRAMQPRIVDQDSPDGK
ncbi:11636_t:CDS:2 [Gigaspora margarita]|uniref:11636_t:CDS:1 n=1 Tax=Gigaspora margarita TaxID=4874 RepID=A0ABN7UIB0_GIGMA|nr:11636_t:CDS:2 [Gigaspora margarita]